MDINFVVNSHVDYYDVMSDVKSKVRRKDEARE